MKEELKGIFNKQPSLGQKPLFIFEMANNHNGDVNHGLRIIRELYSATREFQKDFIFGIKFQYRNLDTFIHPDYKNRMDVKAVKRFSETKLSDEEFKLMKDEVDKLGFTSICTPFDEPSVDKVKEHGFDILKIASCSLTDWPLLEKIALVDMPIIASTASYRPEDIDKVVSFFEHRRKNFIIMHCIGEYPTKRESLQLNQIDLLKKRYPNINIGFSTHEEPDNIDSIKIAVAKNAVVFERHVNVESEKYQINTYSSTPSQIKKWLEAAKEAYQICGVRENRYISSDKEKEDLDVFRRAVFAKTDLKAGEKINKDNIFYAIPGDREQLLANDISKYMEYFLEKDLKANEPVYFKDLKIKNLRGRVVEIIKKIRSIILDSRIILPGKIDLELSHHYGIERYEEFGAAILSCINREYCKKVIIILPKQNHPSHSHLKKEETFQVLYGDLLVSLNGKEKQLKAGDMITIERGVNHSFSSEKGCVFEEISTTHYKEDSFYVDKEISENKTRKTEMTFWADWMYEELK